MDLNQSSNIPQILLVEDDNSLGSSLTERLLEEPYNVTWVKTVHDALTALEKNKFDLCILDVGLPDGSGFNIAREIKVSSHIPVVFLTAMNSPEYRLEGFEIGCDDFIPKPFHLKELLLRIKRITEKKNQLDNNSTNNNNYEFSLDSESLLAKLPDGKIAEFIPSDFSLLKLLVESSPKVVSRQEAYSKVFNNEGNATRAVDNSIVRIRTLLGSFAEGKLKTVRGIGYQWICK